jgi:hypothetical protein
LYTQNNWTHHPRHPNKPEETICIPEQNLRRTLMPNRLAEFLEQKFKERRQDNYKLTITDFGKCLGIGRENLNGYMNQKTRREPRIPHCVTMAKGLGLSLVDFLTLAGMISETDALESKGIHALVNKDIPQAVRSAMATNEWAQLCPSPEEIEIVSRAELKDAEEVLHAIRDFSWRKMKALFLESHAPKTLQEECYRLCRAVVNDWKQSTQEKEKQEN